MWELTFKYSFPLPGALMTWWLWMAGYTQWEAMMAAPVSTPLKSTTHAAINGSQPPACSHGAAAWAWLCWSSWTSRHLPRPPSRFLPPAFDTGSLFGWPQPLLLQPRLALGRDATALFETKKMRRKSAGGWTGKCVEARGTDGPRPRCSVLQN